MNAYELGKLIKEFRERKNISQEDLSENLCAVSTLSRIERGVQYPSRKLLEAFFSRLGETTSNIQIPLSSNDCNRAVLEYQITQSVSRNDSDFLPLLEQYIQAKEELDILEKQFYLFFSTLYKTMTKSESNKEIQNSLFEAIHLTIKDYTLSYDISSHLLTKTELMILLNIARTEYFLGNEDEAISLMESLEKYYTNHTSEDNDSITNLSVIYFNLSNWYGKKNLHQKTLDKCDSGIKLFAKYGKSHYLPYLLFNKGYALLKLNQIKSGTKIVTTALELMLQLGRTQDAEFGVKDIKDSFGISLELSMN